MTNHITQACSNCKNNEWPYGSCDGCKADDADESGANWEAVAETKPAPGELPPLPEHSLIMGGGYFYTAEKLHAYGDARAEQALERAKDAIETANARRVLYVTDCIDVIDALIKELK